MTSLPGPKTPYLFQLFKWITDPVGYMHSTTQKYGDFFRASVASNTIGELVFISNPETLQTIFTNDRKLFPALGEVNQILSSLLGDYSVIMLDGDRHKQRRQLLTPPFHAKQISNYGQIICELSKQVMEAVPVGQSFTARTLTQSITLQVIMKAVFGITEGPRYEELQKLLPSLLESLSSPAQVTFLFLPWLQQDWGTWTPWGKFRQRKAIDDLIYSEINERKASQESRDDILSLLMAAADDQGNSLTDKELRDELMTLLFAGHETTATALAWALYWTHHFPEIKAKILAELATLGENPDPVAITRLPYLSAVCQETLRIYPVAMLTFPRVVAEATQLQGYNLNPGTILTGCIYLTHHRSDLYPEPEKFKPERFLEKQFSPYEFMPFGAGMRRCIGEVLAQFELKLALATILSGYELSLASSFPEKPRRRGLTLAPATGVKMILQGHRTASVEQQQIPLTGVS